MGEVTLGNTLDRLAGGLKERSDALEDLKRLIRHNQRNTKVADLGDASFSRIFEALFVVAISEQATLTKATTNTTRSAAEGRLSKCSSTLRLAVEVGLRSVKPKTVQSLLDHITERLRLSNGDFCEPLALDYAKCLHTVLNYQPHVERLPQAEWERVVDFCLSTLHDGHSAHEDGEMNSPGEVKVSASATKLSYRSFRSYVKDASGSQAARPVLKQITEVMAGALVSLTSTPNAPIKERASSTLWGLIDFLRFASPTARLHQDAFSTINNILLRVAAEDIGLMRKAVSPLIRLMRNFWGLKSPALKDELLVTFLHLQPFITEALRKDGAPLLRPELSALLETMRSDYSKRSERELLRLEDLRLGFFDSASAHQSTIHCSSFALRCAGSKAEQSWTIVWALTFLTKSLAGDLAAVESSEDAEDNVSSRPRKRQRRAHDLDELIASWADNHLPSRLTGLQIATTLALQTNYTVSLVARMMDNLIPLLADENGSVASWSQMTIACLAAGTVSTNIKLASRWANVWQISSRAISNSSTCQAACHLVHTILKLRLVEVSAILEFVQAITTSIEVNGPSILVDSALQLLAAVNFKSQQLNPASSTTTSESVLFWLFRTWMPSRFNDRSHLSITQLDRVNDLVDLIRHCLNQALPSAGRFSAPTWGRVAQTWITCQDRRQLFKYLLLDDSQPSPIQKGLFTPNYALDSPVLQLRLSCETTTLNHFDLEIQRTIEAWSLLRKERAKQISLDTFRHLCQSATSMTCVMYGTQFRDQKRQTHIQSHLQRLWDDIITFVEAATCEQEKVDILLACCAQFFDSSLQQASNLTNPSASHENVLCGLIKRMAISRRHNKDSMDIDEYYEDDMDTDHHHGSQDSRQGTNTISAENLTDELAASFSRAAFRSRVTMYAFMHTSARVGQIGDPDDIADVSAAVIDFALDLPEHDLFSACKVLTKAERMGLQLKSSDVEHFLEHFMSSIVNSYAFGRSEVALCAIVDILAAWSQIWTSKDRQSLYDLGLDTYTWFLRTALPACVFSPNVQKRIASLLLQLAHIDTEYGRDGDAPSVRTGLFKLIQMGNITVKYHLAERISPIFGLYVLSTHVAMFDDLQESLPADAEWTEGIGLRLLFLSKLAASWHSLLRQCMYYLFETAGRVQHSMQYAARCIEDIAKSLGFHSSERIFTLFAPQMLHTWLSSNSLSNLPFAAFNFKSLDDLLRLNEAEIAAQIFMRGNEEALETLARAVKCDKRTILERCFARCAAYALSCDIAQASSDSDKASIEKHLQSVIGSRERWKFMLRDTFPTVVGYFLLSMQLNESAEKTLEKHKAYDRAASIVAEIRGYSHSDAHLPPGQQPSFKGRYLVEQVERLCRRTGIESSKAWDVSSFVLAARVLLDALDESLSSLSSCYIIRKIRLLVAMSCDVALAGYPLEMLIHAVRPYLTDSQCADDTVGLLQYLLKRGEQYLKSSSSFYYGTATLILIQLRQYMSGKQDSTTQSTQHNATVEKMQNLYDWTIQQLQQNLEEVNGHDESPYPGLIASLAQMRMPGNALAGSPESKILLILLKQRDENQDWISREDCSEGIELLSKDFVVAATVGEDCLGADEAASEYSQSLWNVVQEQKPGRKFTQWAAKTIGRAFAGNGFTPCTNVVNSVAKTNSAQTSDEALHESHVLITRKLKMKLRSRDKCTASLAEHTLRMIENAYQTSDAEKAVALEQTLPDNIVSAIQGGLYGYEPAGSVFARLTQAPTSSIQNALSLSHSTSLQCWSTQVAITLCHLFQEHPMLGCLPSMLRSLPGFALEVLPSIIHIALFEDIDHGGSVRDHLSTSFNAHFAEGHDEFRAKQRFLLQTILYLRSCPYPKGVTKADSLRWLDIDYLSSATTANDCNMHTTALMLTESSIPVAPVSRRTLRASASQNAPIQASDELLLSIFKNVGEPDSFYGIQQSASLDSVLERLDFEADGYKSLMFRSAQMDSHMTQHHKSSKMDATGLLQSLTTMNLSSVTLALMSAGTASTTRNDATLDTARRLQQWDAAPPKGPSGAAALFSVLQDLSQSVDVDRSLGFLDEELLRQLDAENLHKADKRLSVSFMQTLASLTEISDVLSLRGLSSVQSLWGKMEKRQDWMHLSRFEDFQTCLSTRETLFSVIGDNKSIAGQMRLGVRDIRTIQSKALLASSTMSRLHGKIQSSLSAATQMIDLAEQCAHLGLSMEAASRMAVASVLADVGEVETSVNIMKAVVKMRDFDHQSIKVGRSDLLAQLGHKVESFRLEKPEDILDSYLKPAVAHLRGVKLGREASNVFYEFASFCDRQLQNPGNLEDFNRLARMREQKYEEVEAFETLLKNTKKSTERDKMSRQYKQAKMWLQIDNQEFKRQKESRDAWMQQSLQNYLLALQASDEHDICVLRFFAMWLENDDSNVANETVASELDSTPSWKFVVLLNQLMSRLKAEQSKFQRPLMGLARRICSEHPYHSLHHLFASTRNPKIGDDAARLRHAAASEIRKQIYNDQNKGPLLKRVFDADRQYNHLAWAELEGRKSSKISLKDLPQAYHTSKLVPDRKVPPATIHLDLRPDGNYEDVPVVVRFENTVSIMTGLSAPKLLTAIGSDGQPYKQLFKSGNDDLRQDTIMEQVFEEVSKMLRNHKGTRQRSLHVRTYKVIPLEAQSGIIEFVRNSIPINDVLQELHARYHPQDWKQQVCRTKIGAVAGQSAETRIKEFRKICEHVHPVLRHFFFEQYNSPDEWFLKRTAYTRTTASVSILGHVLGLGDRHCHNILLDKTSGEVVHIDLGVAFEGGRVLPIPELVPFRLTRDIVDGMGITKTEGTFRRCCEFTMEALRKDKDSIMTLLSVLRYDPLQTWGVSPLRAKRMQDAQINTEVDGAPRPGASSKRKENEAAEAERALTVVEKKLSQTLSTSATVNELIQQATDEKNLATLFMGWAAFY